MKGKNFFWILIAAALTFQACDNTIELEAPYKEIGVVYGLINPSDSIHYIRIQKAFLGKGNAIEMGQVTDSIYYPDVLDAKLERVKNGSVLETINLARFNAWNKDEGTFPSAPNFLYKTNGERIFQDSEYRLTVTNTLTGYQMVANTPIVDSIVVIKPSYSSTALISFANDIFPYNVRFVPSADSKVYNLTIRFKYTEDINNVVTAHYIDWAFPNKIISNSSSASEVEIEIPGEDFYEFVASKLNPEPNTIRFAGNLDFIFTTGSEFLSNYISINQATTSILTSIPQYSNVENGTGIFSSRFIQVSPDKSLDQASLEKLRNGPITGDLGFQ
jgi:hypothetical protein